MLEKPAEAYADEKAKELKQAAGGFGITDVLILPYTDRPLKRTVEIVNHIVALVCEVKLDIPITECPAHIAATRSHSIPNDHYTTSAMVTEALTIAAFPATGTNRAAHQVVQVYYLGVDLAYREVDLIVDNPDQYENWVEAETAIGSLSQSADYARKRVETLPGYFGFMPRVSYTEPFVRGSMRLDRRLPVSRLELNRVREKPLTRIERQELKCD